MVSIIMLNTVLFFPVIAMYKTWFMCVFLAQLWSLLGLISVGFLYFFCFVFIAGARGWFGVSFVSLFMNT